MLARLLQYYNGLNYCNSNGLKLLREKDILPIPLERDETDGSYGEQAHRWEWMNTLVEPNMDRRAKLPKNQYANCFVHTYTHGELGVPSLHDHPWWSISFLLHGEMEEVVFDCGRRHLDQIRHASLKAYHKGGLAALQDLNVVKPPVKHIPVPRVLIRPPSYAHSVLLKSESAKTLFITGPRVQNWGFYTEYGWIPFQLMADFADLLKTNSKGATEGLA